MPGYKYDQLIENNSFGSKLARQNASQFRKYLKKAAESLATKPETEELAKELLAYEQAVRDVSLRRRMDSNTKKLIINGLKKLEGLAEFMEAETASGATNYELLAKELDALGDDHKEMGQALQFLSGTLALEVDVDALEKTMQRRADRSQVRNPPPQPQPPQPQQNVPQPAGGEKHPEGQQLPPEKEEELPPEEGSPLNINELLAEKGKEAVPEEQPEEAPAAETADFEEIKVSGKENPTPSEAFDAYFDKQHSLLMEDKVSAMSGADLVAMAMDEKGRQYKSADEIKNELSKPGRRLFVFRKDGTLPHAMENRDGKLYVSDGAISAANQLPGSGKYAPKKSLKATDIAEIPTNKAANSAEEHYKDWKLRVQQVKRKIDDLQTVIKEEEKWGDKSEFGYPALKKPKEPTGIGTWFWRIAVKVGTLGFGESRAFRDYKRQQQDYEKHIADHPERMKTLRAKYKELNEQHAEYQKTASAYREQSAQLKAANRAADPEKGKAEIQEYRKRTEVRMEGVADIIKNGRVTQHNVFAHTWMKMTACQGKAKEDPEAIRNLMEYIVSRTVEEEVLKNTVEDKEYSGARNERMTEIINNGSGMKKMESDELFRKVMQKQAGKTIDPEKIYEEYVSLSAARNAELNHPLVRLKKERERLIESFGSKPVTEDCLADVVRLNMLDGSIRAAEKLPKDPNMISKNDSINFSREQADIYRNNEVNGRMSPERREAMAQVSAAEENAGKTFTLEQMAKMVNDTVQRNQAQKHGQPQEIL